MQDKPIFVEMKCSLFLVTITLYYRLAKQVKPCLMNITR